MLNLDLTVSIDDYPQADFPEFYPDFIDEVLAQLNTLLKKSADEPLPEEATPEEALQCLKDDILKHPDLYLTGELLNKISRFQRV